MFSAPMKPASTAPHRCAPTFSPSSGTDRAVTASGAVKLIAAAVASEVETSAVKYRIEERMPHKPLAICKPGRFVLTMAHPYRVTKIASRNTKAPPWRKNTTCMGW